ncbi:hypothetical protein MTO96_009376 [Rhipicephalus appendiculatus]
MCENWGRVCCLADWDCDISKDNSCSSRCPHADSLKTGTEDSQQSRHRPWIVLPEGTGFGASDIRSDNCSCCKLEGAMKETMWAGWQVRRR